MKIKTTLTSLSVMLLFVCTSFGQSQDEDVKAITTTLNYYLDGGTNRDFNTLKKAFHKNATMKYIKDGKYIEVNALEFFGSRMKPGPKSNRETYIAQITIFGSAANARLELVYPDRVLTDYMNLLKVDGQWKIVGKIFATRKNMEAKE